MAKTPTKKPAAKRGGKKKSAQVNKAVKAKKRAPSPPMRKPTKRARNAALPHYDPVDVAFTPEHPTVEEQYLRDLELAGKRGIDKAPKPGLWTRFRSAITGLFVSLGFAKRHPATTVGEKVER